MGYDESVFPALLVEGSIQHVPGYSARTFDRKTIIFDMKSSLPHMNQYFGYDDGSVYGLMYEYQLRNIDKIILVSDKNYIVSVSIDRDYIERLKGLQSQYGGEIMLIKYWIATWDPVFPDGYSVLKRLTHDDIQTIIGEFSTLKSDSQMPTHFIDVQC